MSNKSIRDWKKPKISKKWQKERFFHFCAVSFLGKISSSVEAIEKERKKVDKEID